MEDQSETDDDSVPVAEMLQLQLSEYEMLKSMYPDETEMR